MPEKQTTLAGELSFAGKGLHTGEEAKITLRPAPPDSGLRLRVGGVEERLRPSLSNGERNCNSIKTGSGEVQTIEHLFSALWGMGIDNVVVDVDGGEIPGLDGSALKFVEAIRKTGVTEQQAERRVFIPASPVSVGDAGAGITAYPSKDGKFRITYTLDYRESKLARGTVTVVVDPASYQETIAPARTFVPKQLAEQMLAAGLGKGADTTNTLVLDGDTLVDNSFRLDNECVRHKILDMIGDLAVLNRRLGVHIVAYRSGHALNIELAAALARAISKAENPKGVLDIRAIAELLPHRYPFLLVDRVLELEEKKRIVALKNVTGNEEFFQGHFPGQPIMPGVLQIEALAQAGAIMMLGEFKGQGKLAVLMSVDEVKWRRQVVPGDQIMMYAEFIKMKSRIGIVRAWSTVDGDPTVECVIKFALVDAATGQ